MEAPHHKYCKCPDCELFAQMQAHFGTNEPEPNTRPLPQPSELVERLRATIIQDVCELPDYNSPDDQPDLLQCTVEELQIILTRNLEAFGQCDLTDFAPLTNSALRAQIAKLQARLEVVPGWSEDADGIACRNDTIKLQDECIAKLQADGDKLAGALEQLIKHTTWLESVAPPMCIDGKYMGESLSLADACQALTEWKDRA